MKRLQRELVRQQFSYLKGQYCSKSRAVRHPDQVVNLLKNQIANELSNLDVQKFRLDMQLNSRSGQLFRKITLLLQNLLKERVLKAKLKWTQQVKGKLLHLFRIIEKQFWKQDKSNQQKFIELFSLQVVSFLTLPLQANFSMAKVEFCFLRSGAKIIRRATESQLAQLINSLQRFLDKAEGKEQFQKQLICVKVSIQVEKYLSSHAHQKLRQLIEWLLPKLQRSAFVQQYFESLFFLQKFSSKKRSGLCKRIQETMLHTSVDLSFSVASNIYFSLRDQQREITRGLLFQLVKKLEQENPGRSGCKLLSKALKELAFKQILYETAFQQKTQIELAIQEFTQSQSLKKALLTIKNQNVPHVLKYVLATQDFSQLIQRIQLVPPLINRLGHLLVPKFVEDFTFALLRLVKNIKPSFEQLSSIQKSICELKPSTQIAFFNSLLSVLINEARADQQVLTTLAHPFYTLLQLMPFPDQLSPDAQTKQSMNDLVLIVFHQPRELPENYSLVGGLPLERDCLFSSQFLRSVRFNKDLKHILQQQDTLKLKALIANILNNAISNIEFFKSNSLKSPLLSIPALHLNKSQSIAKLAFKYLQAFKSLSVKSFFLGLHVPQLINQIIFLEESSCSSDPAVSEWSSALLKETCLLYPQYAAQDLLLKAFSNSISLYFAQSKNTEAFLQNQIKTLQHSFYLPSSQLPLYRQFSKYLHIVCLWMFGGLLISPVGLSRKVDQLRMSQGRSNQIGLSAIKFMIDNIQIGREQQKQILGNFNSNWLSNTFKLEMSNLSLEKCTSNKLIESLLLDSAAQRLIDLLEVALKKYQRTFIYSSNSSFRPLSSQVFHLAEKLLFETDPDSKIHTEEQLLRAVQHNYCRGSKQIILFISQTTRLIFRYPLAVLGQCLFLYLSQRIIAGGQGEGLLISLSAQLDQVVSLINEAQLQELRDQSKSVNIFRVNSQKQDYRGVDLQRVGWKSTREGLLEIHLLHLKFIQKCLQALLLAKTPLRTLVHYFQKHLLIDMSKSEFLPLQNILLLLKNGFELISLANRSQELFQPRTIQQFFLSLIQLGLSHFDRVYEFHSIPLIKNKYTRQQLHSKRLIFKAIEAQLQDTHFLSHFRILLKSESSSRKIQFGQNQDRPNSLLSTSQLLKQLIKSEIQLILSVTQSAAISKSQVDRIFFQETIKLLGPSNQSLSLSCLLQLKNYLRGGQQTFKSLQGEIVKTIFTSDPSWKKYWAHPSFLQLFIDHNRMDLQLSQLAFYWTPPDIQLLLGFLEDSYFGNPVQLYALNCLSTLESSQLLFYLPQLIIAITKHCGDSIMIFLQQYASKYTLFQHQLLWALKVQFKQEQLHKPPVRTAEHSSAISKLRKQSQVLYDKVLRSMSREQAVLFEQEDLFFQKVTSICAKMVPSMTYQTKKVTIATQLSLIKPTQNIYLPTNPRFKVLQVISSSGTPMQSAAKVPFRATFVCAEYGGPDQNFEMNKRLPFAMQQSYMEQTQKVEQKCEISCIFKVFDDIRQDCLALQIAALLEQILRQNRVQAKLFPYRTISNRTGKNLDLGGIIECIPNSTSRDEIGKIHSCDLFNFFVSRFGPEFSQGFVKAQRNLIRSLAGYSLFCYLMQVKDRHNGNILIDEKGHIIHIDFGFIFDISPGGNMRFQSAHFKITSEIIRVLGGVDSNTFRYFENLLIKAFLVSRKYSQHILRVVKPMLHSSLNCFHPGSMERLQQRFKLELTESEASEVMRAMVKDCAQKWTTVWYDRIQWMQNKIHH